MVDVEAVTVALQERKLQDLLTCMDLTASQRHITRKYMEFLIGKLHSVHLIVPGAVAHIYHIHLDLTQVG